MSSTRSIVSTFGAPRLRSALERGAPLPTVDNLQLGIREYQEGGRTRFALAGELDLATAPALRDRLNQSRADRRDVRLDLSRVEFIDSAGIHVLVEAVNDARSEGVRLDVEGSLAPQVKRIAELTHFRSVHISRT